MFIDIGIWLEKIKKRKGKDYNVTNVVSVPFLSKLTYQLLSQFHSSITTQNISFRGKKKKKKRENHTPLSLCI